MIGDTSMLVKEFDARLKEHQKDFDELKKKYDRLQREAETANYRATVAENKLLYVTSQNIRIEATLAQTEDMRKDLLFFIKKALEALNSGKAGFGITEAKAALEEALP